MPRAGAAGWEEQADQVPMVVAVVGRASHFLPARITRGRATPQLGARAGLVVSVVRERPVERVVLAEQAVREVTATAAHWR